MTRIAIFGGTFDPPHNGHIGMADAILAQGAADKILFLPAYRPPHKEASPCLTAFDDRITMLHLAIAGKEAMFCSDFEAHRLEKSYTFDTLTMLSQIHPETELSWIIGGDSLLQLHTWYHARELVRKFRFITFPRPGNPITIETLRTHWSKEDAERLFQSVLWDSPEYSISSTQIRNLLQTGADVSFLLPPSVLNYIELHHLYSK